MNENFPKFSIRLCFAAFRFRLCSREFTLVLLFSLVLMPMALLAAPGDLDPDFGDGGQVITSVPVGENQTDGYPYAILSQPDGKVIVAGSAHASASNSSSYSYFALIRYQTDGTLDPTFGSGGHVYLPRDICAAITDLALQSDGKIVALGVAGCQGFGIQSTIFRLNINGSLDISFGQGGKVQLTVPDRYVQINTLAVAENDQILVGGSITPFFPNPNAFDFLVARFTATGMLDNTFGIDGIVVTDLTGVDEYINEVAVQPDGKIVAVGDAAIALNDTEIRVVRYTASGLLDTSFGDDGSVALSLTPSSEYATNVVLQSDDKIIVAGHSDNDLLIVRFLSDGAIDTSFADVGILSGDFGGNDATIELLLQSDGKLVVADQTRILRFDASGLLDSIFANNGTFENGEILEALMLQADDRIIAVGSDQTGLYNQFSTLRLTANGALDATFGDGGRVITALQEPVYGSSVPSAVEQQNDGRLVVVGSVYNGSNNDLLVARYLDDGSLDQTFGNRGITVTDVGNARQESARDLLLIHDSKPLIIGDTYDELTDNREILLVRYTADGILDSTFGTNGVAATDLGATADESVAAAALQSDGKLVAVGTIRQNDSLLQLLIVRFNSDGSLDTTFGNGGTTILELSSEANDTASSVFVHADGKIMVAAKTSVYDALLDDYLGQAVLLRFLTDGTLDANFGSNGIVLTGLPNTDMYIADMGLQSDGKIVLAGTAYDYDTSFPDFLLIRYNSDGSLDTTWGTDGIAIQDMGSEDGETISAVAVQQNNKVVVTGSIVVDSFGTNQFITARFNIDGTLDALFGDNGQIRTGFGTELRDQARDLLIQPNGKIVVVGSSYDPVNFEDPSLLALARYEGDPVNQVPVASGQAITTDEDTPISITLTAGDPDSDPITYTLVTLPQHGMLTGVSPNLTYTPTADYNGSDSFTFQVNDGQVDSNLATISITVNAVNDAPIAVGDMYTTTQTVTLTVSGATGLLANDSDIEGDGLTALLVSPPVSGTIQLSADGAFTYTPHLNVTGIDHFTYQATDAITQSNIATVTIAIEALPLAEGDCNGDVLVDAGDLSAIVLEIFDGDGALAQDATGGTFAGESTCDANGDSEINAADLSCTVLLIFNGPHSCVGAGNDPAEAAALLGISSVELTDIVEEAPHKDVHLLETLVEERLDAMAHESFQIYLPLVDR